MPPFASAFGAFSLQKESKCRVRSLYDVKSLKIHCKGVPCEKASRNTLNDDNGPWPDFMSAP